MAAKPHLYLTGPTDDGPSFDDLMALFRQLTGKEPTAAEYADAKKEFEKGVKK